MEQSEKFTPYVVEKSKRFIEEAKATLKKDFGIDKLSNLELFELQHALQEVMEAYPVKESSKNQLEKNQEFALRFGFGTPGDEIIDRWLSRVYNIRITDVPLEYTVKDETTGDVYFFTGTYSDVDQDTLWDMQKKKRQLRELGHKVKVSKAIPEEFKAKLKAEANGRNMI